jgi:hypothetical protein
MGDSMSARSIFLRRVSDPATILRFVGTTASVVADNLDPGTDYEWDDGTGLWRPVATPSGDAWAAVTASGADTSASITVDGDPYTYHRWITPGAYDIEVTQEGYVEAVVIGGGGGGGRPWSQSRGGGGGEAGQVAQRMGAQRLWVPAGLYRLVIGAGGEGGRGSDGGATAGVASSFGAPAGGYADLGIDALTALGGARGGGQSSPPGDGGGGWRDFPTTGLPGAATGFIGGNMAGDAGGGGAGNGGNGGNANINDGAGHLSNPGPGGVGVTIDIIGTIESVGGGGPGSPVNASSLTRGLPSAYGSGASNVSANDPGRNGVPGTGGGGAGTSNWETTTGRAHVSFGGSGQVTVRVRTA